MGEQQDKGKDVWYTSIQVFLHLFSYVSYLLPDALLYLFHILTIPCLASRTCLLGVRLLTHNRFWADSFPSPSQSTISLFETYAHVPASELQQHVDAVREKGWKAFHYPCIGSYRFLDFSVSLNPQYLIPSLPIRIQINCISASSQLSNSSSI